MAVHDAFMGSTKVTPDLDLVGQLRVQADTKAAHSKLF